MPFTTTADSIFDGFKSSIMTTGQAARVQAYGVESANEVNYPHPTYYVTANNLGSRWAPVVTQMSVVKDEFGKQETLVTLTRTELNNFFSFVQDNTDTNYRTVKNNNLWRTLYGVNGRTFDTYDSKSNTRGTKQYDTTYCQKCHVVLPLRNLTIDHQKPQKGGEMQAMMRVFRAAGLTISTGTGNKNRYLQGQVAQGVGGNTTVLPRGGTRGSDADRYSLSTKGIIYYTALYHAKQAGAMLAMSMHHIANLRPMCGPCNSSLRNSNVTWLDQ